MLPEEELFLVEFLHLGQVLLFLEGVPLFLVILNLLAIECLEVLLLNLVARILEE